MANLNMETRIEQVTVFRDGARVTRSGTVSAAPGEHVVAVSGITGYAQVDSFRVKGRGSAVLRGIDVSTLSRTYEPEGEISELRQELKRLERQRDEITDRVSQQQARIGYLQAIMSQFNSEFGKWFAAGESKLDVLTTMDKTGPDLIRDATKKLRAAQKELKDLQDQMGAVQANIQRVQGERRTETVTEVRVSVNVTEKTALELDVTYQIGLSGWSPTYDVDIGDGRTRVKRIAMLTNRSLEDWTDVALTVSTASARPVAAVEATPFYVDVYQAVAEQAAASVTGRGLLFKEKAKAYEPGEREEMGDMLAEAPEPVIAEVTARVSESLSGTVVYEVPGRVTIASDDEEHPITLTEESFTSKRLYYWNAYAMPEVVAQDEITNGESVLLPGRVKIYASGDFLGESSIGIIAPREQFRLGARTSYDMKAEKKLIMKDTEKAGLVKGRRRREYKYRLDLKSFAKAPINIRVVDRIPHSASERIIAQLQAPSLAYKSFEMGVLEWDASVEAGKTLEISYGFAIEWEKDVTITPSLP